MTNISVKLNISVLLGDGLEVCEKDIPVLNYYHKIVIQLQSEKTYLS